MGGRGTFCGEGQSSGRAGEGNASAPSCLPSAPAPLPPLPYSSGMEKLVPISCCPFLWALSAAWWRRACGRGKEIPLPNGEVSRGRQWAGTCRGPMSSPGQAGARTLHWGHSTLPQTSAACHACRARHRWSRRVLFEAPTVKPPLTHLDGGAGNIQSSKLPNYETGQILDLKNSPCRQCDSKRVCSDT